MRILLLLSFLVGVILIWDVYSSASANRGLQPPEVLPAMRIQIRSSSVSVDSSETMKPGEILFFRQGSPTE